MGNDGRALRDGRSKEKMDSTGQPRKTNNNSVNKTNKLYTRRAAPVINSFSHNKPKAVLCVWTHPPWNENKKNLPRLLSFVVGFPWFFWGNEKRDKLGGRQMAGPDSSRWASRG